MAWHPWLPSTIACTILPCVLSFSNALADEAADRFAADVRPFLQKYCIDCHSQGSEEAGISLDSYSSDQEALQAGELWVKALDVLESRSMPPPDAPQPTISETEAIVDWIESDFVKSLSQQDRQPTAPVARRLNRTEYNNTIRDLLNIDIDLAKEFPPDDIGYGFDNIGSVLSISPVHFEKLLSAAEQAAKAAIWTPDAEGSPPIELIGLKTYPLSKEAPVEFDHTLAPGLYLTEFSLVRVGIAETVTPPLLEINFGQDRRNVAAIRVQDETVVYRFWISVLDGDTKVTVRVLSEFGAAENAEASTKAVSGDQRYGNSFGLHVDSMVVRGPVTNENAALGPSLADLPFAAANYLTDQAREKAAENNLRLFLRRAFRKPPLDEEIDRLMNIYRIAVTKGESFQHAMQLVLTAVLVSPQFLFIHENNRDLAGGLLNEHELATRLSYFLWSTMPDDELSRLADEENLRKNLDEQLARMIQDPRSSSFVESFCGQWLQLRRLDEVSPDQELFPSFNDELRESMRRESELYFAYVLQNNRSALELIDSDYTFVNRLLATHYGFDNFNGEEFVKVAVSNGQRGGVLTHASVLTVTSNPNRTSPVKRGKWVLQQILGTPPPPPPTLVETLDESSSASEEASLRERLVQHRENPACASCHSQMDPIGFALENYNAVGQWRTIDSQFPIDASGEFPGGIAFEDGKDFKQKLTDIGRKRFGRSIIKNLMTYSLGRGLELQDISTVEEIRKKWELDDYRFQSLIFGIVHSRTFQSRGTSAHAASQQ